jgi:hypothetical protein
MYGYGRFFTKFHPAEYMINCLKAEIQNPSNEKEDYIIYSRF